jgi:hypothetical protein
MAASLYKYSGERVKSRKLNVEGGSGEGEDERAEDFGDGE